MDTTVQIFKALSEEIRLRLLALLADGELCVCDLMGGLDLPQSTISRHLSYLKNAGWVEGRRQGLWMYYRIADEMTPLHLDLLEALKKSLQEREKVREDRKRFAAYMKTKKKEACS